MKILHELLATEKNFTGQVNKLILETLSKFDKEHFFKSYVKTLKMLKDAPGNEEIEQAGSDKKELVSTVFQTLEYVLNFWAESEDMQATKNRTNQHAVADVMLGDTVFLRNLPVDELLGLEARLLELRKVFEKIPTLDASRIWTKADTVGRGAWEGGVDTTTKTEKVVTPVVLYEATKEHPAQVKEVTRDEVVGTFRTRHFSGAATSLQKAQVLDRLDMLLIEVKRARMRANSVAVESCDVGKDIVDYLLQPFRL